MFSCMRTDSPILWIEVSNRVFRAALPRTIACIRPCRPWVIISSYHRPYKRINSNFMRMEASLPTWWAIRLTRVSKHLITTNRYLWIATLVAFKTTTTSLLMMDQVVPQSTWAHRVQTTCERRRWPPQSASRCFSPIRSWINSITTCSNQDKIRQKWTRTI